MTLNLTPPLHSQYSYVIFVIIILYSVNRTKTTAKGTRAIYRVHAGGSAFCVTSRLVPHEKKNKIFVQPFYCRRSGFGSNCFEYITTIRRQNFVQNGFYDNWLFFIQNRILGVNHRHNVKRPGVRVFVVIMEGTTLLYVYR